ncbi:MAG: hypothetical protein ACRENB_01710 [Gemmatimonadales bacterium]
MTLLRALPFVVLGLAACGPRADRRLERLSSGISVDSTLKVMGVDQANRTDAYLVQGKSVQALYFARPGASDSADLADRKMSPVVVIDGKVVGWGWEKWDSLAGVYQIQVAPRDRD